MTKSNRPSASQIREHYHYANRQLKMLFILLSNQHLLYSILETIERSIVMLKNMDSCLSTNEKFGAHGGTRTHTLLTSNSFLDYRDCQFLHMRFRKLFIRKLELYIRIALITSWVRNRRSSIWANRAQENWSRMQESNLRLYLSLQSFTIKLIRHYVLVLGIEPRVIWLTIDVSLKRQELENLAEMKNRAGECLYVFISRQDVSSRAA